MRRSGYLVAALVLALAAALFWFVLSDGWVARLGGSRAMTSLPWTDRHRGGPSVRPRRRGDRTDALLAEMLTSLREGQSALDAEVQPLLQAAEPDWSMLERLRDVADELAGHARDLRQMLIGRGADPDALEEVDRLCRYFDGTAGLIAQETGDADNAASADDEAGRGSGCGETRS